MNGTINLNQSTVFKQIHFHNSSHKIIINADDLGICKERDKGIFEMFSNGYISSATALVNFPNSKSSIQKARELNLPIGLHLNLTEGSPIYQTNIENNGLVDYDEESETYQFHGKFGFREKLHTISLSDIRNEITSQVILII